MLHKLLVFYLFPHFSVHPVFIPSGTGNNYGSFGISTVSTCLQAVGEALVKHSFFLCFPAVDGV